jgi:anti-sigma factor RsiW
MTDDDLACTDEVELMTEYLEGALVPAEARRLERHLETCPACTEYLRQMRTVAGSLRGLTRDSISHQTREDLLAAFRDFRKG